MKLLVPMTNMINASKLFVRPASTNKGVGRPISRVPEHVITNVMAMGTKSAA